MTRPTRARARSASPPATPGAGADLTVRLLGPMEVLAAGRPVTPQAGRLRALLAVLAMSAGRTVTVDDLGAALWSEAPPANVRRSVQIYVTRLRGLLGADVIDTRPAGYALAVEADQVDALRFLALVDRARQEPDQRERRERLVEALGLWRGTPFADVPSAWLAESEAARLGERFLLALERRIDLDLAAGRHGELVPELSELTARNPLRESLWVRLLVVLDRCGRPAEALTRYEVIRTRLAEELGVDPGAELRAAFADLLAGRKLTLADPAAGAPGQTERDGAAPAADPPPPEFTLPKPRQLPADPAAFTGRRAELRRLDELLPDASAGRTATSIVVVHGSAGIGKTALAVHWAHLVRARFPDGQLYVDLRGWAPSAPAGPAEVLAGFLRALGEPAERIPTELDEAAALFRTLLADRRVLVVLDNAGALEQLRPLLPASPGCMVLVTSRDRLSGLVAREGARRVALDLLSQDEATTLLARALPERARAEPAALADLADACDYLPLALRIAAANLADRPAQRVADYVAVLRGNRLGALQVDGDEHSAVRAAFDLSDAALDEAARVLFRRLGLLIGHDVTPPAAAALAGTTTEDAQRLLERLAGAALLVEHASERYGFHDLLRLYATERARLDPLAERDAALARYYGWLLATADAAARLLNPNLVRLPLPEPDGRGPGPVTTFADQAQALAWLDAERANLVAVVEHAADYGPREVAWCLADAMRGYLWLRMDPVDWPAVAEAALRAAVADGDLRAQAASQLSLADLYRRRSQHARALEALAVAGGLCEATGWLEGQISVAGSLGGLYWVIGELEQAAEQNRRLLELGERTGSVAVRSRGLGSLGMVCYALGRLRDAAHYHERALELDRESGNQLNEAHAQGNLGQTYHLLGRLTEACAHLEQALALRRRIGDRGGQGDALGALAALHRDRGDLDAALATGTAALALAQAIGESWLEADVRNDLGTIASRRDDLPTALDHHRRALELARGTRTTSTEVAALQGLAAVQQRLGEDASARANAERAVALARSARYRALEGQALTITAQVGLAQGRLCDAVATARKALAVHEETGHLPGVARTLLVLGAALHAAGEPEEAADHLRTGAAILAELGLPDTEAAALDLGGEGSPATAGIPNGQAEPAPARQAAGNGHGAVDVPNVRAGDR